MEKDQPVVGTSFLWFLAAGLALYCIVITAITGDIGFDGDDWWVISVPYWNSFLDAVLFYGHKFLRPLEGLYLIVLFKLVGFNKIAFHLCSLLLLAGSALLMGASLDRAFPGRRDFVSIAVLLAFFLPPVSCLTYVMFTDNSRLCMLFFWASVIAFQHWAGKSSSWGGLLLGMVLYLGSFLTYEAASFLIFAAPLLVWPVHRRSSDGSSDLAFLVKLCSAILTAFVVAVAIRAVFLSGGASKTCFLAPPFEMVWTYFALLPVYLVSPFTSMSADGWALLAGVIAVLITVGILLVSRRERPADEGEARDRDGIGAKWLIVALGGALLVLGMLPYQIAGYGCGALAKTVMMKYGLLPEGDLSWFNFSWSSRLYSSASFGVAILLAFALTWWRGSSAKLIGKVAAVVIIAFMAVFHAGLSQDWREAAEIRTELVRSLISQVPAVKSGTNLVFLDVVCSHKRAAVIRRENGLRELIQMLYGDRTLGAWHLYPYAYDPVTHLYQQSVVTPAGFQCRSQRQPGPAPEESLILLKRSGHKLVVLDRIAKDDGLVPTGIAWKGVESITSNRRRIIAEPKTPSQEKFASTASRSGLFSTFDLEDLKSPSSRETRVSAPSVHGRDRK